MRRYLLLYQAADGEPAITATRWTNDLNDRHLRQSETMLSIFDMHELRERSPGTAGEWRPIPQEEHYDHKSSSG